MPGPTPPGGRRRPPGMLAEIRATGTRRRRYVERRAPDPGPRAAWAFAVVALVMGIGFIVVIAFGGTDPRTGSVPTATPTRGPTMLPARPSAAASDALAVIGNGPGRTPVGTPARPPIPTPTLVAGEPGARTLRVDFPQDGDTVVSGHINVFGRAPGGARVVRELPDGSEQDTVARPDGLWIMGVDLVPGDNVLRFWVAGEPGEPVVVRVTYQPR